jgi:hypothetical protein
MPNPKKDAVAQVLIDWHFKIEPELTAVYRILAKNEDGAEEPIKLLEVNAATVETGRVEPFGFGPSDDITFPRVIAEVTPGELKKIEQGLIPLPEGWSLEGVKPFLRPKGADAA